jgi:hypothetical protein
MLGLRQKGRMATTRLPALLVRDADNFESTLVYVARLKSGSQTRHEDKL